MEEPGWLQSMGHKVSDTTEWRHFHFLLQKKSLIGYLERSLQASEQFRFQRSWDWSQLPRGPIAQFHGPQG